TCAHHGRKGASTRDLLCRGKGDCAIVDTTYHVVGIAIIDTSSVNRPHFDRHEHAVHASRVQRIAALIESHVRTGGFDLALGSREMGEVKACFSQTQVKIKIIQKISVQIDYPGMGKGFISACK